jgi:uncharacterized protein (TIGR00251 family)
MTSSRGQPTKGRVRLAVRVQPRASRSEVVGAYGDGLKVRLMAPPVEGAANEELVELLARTFAVARRSIRILAGERSRSKIVELEGITDGDVRAVVDGVVRRATPQEP